MEYVNMFDKFVINESKKDKKDENTDKPIISTIKKFKEAVRKTELTNVYTGKTTQAFELIYGFKGNGYYIEATNIKDAYKYYKDNYKKYDIYISDNSFLRDKK